MTQPDAPKIVFPCDYPIKVMGAAGDELHHTVLTVMRRHAPGFDETQLSVRDSAQGKFQAITVTITATGTEQLQAIHAELKASAHVKLVL